MKKTISTAPGAKGGIDNTLVAPGAAPLKRCKKSTKLAEDRILQLSNGLAENEVDTGTIDDWRKVALYWMNLYSKAEVKNRATIATARAFVAALIGANDLKKFAEKELVEWYAAVNAEQKAEREEAIK